MAGNRFRVNMARPLELYLHAGAQPIDFALG